MKQFIECVDCLIENKKYIAQGVKWNFPAAFIYKGKSYCRRHLVLKMYKKKGESNEK
jgi:hypothetical protein